MQKSNYYSFKKWKQGQKVLLIAALAIIASIVFAQLGAVKAAPGDLTVEIVAGYNLVVDSNVQAPSTYAPRVATVMGRFCNTSGTALTDVVGYIGDYAGAGSGTPGVYPSRTSGSGSFDADHPHLAGTGPYVFSHLASASDASRYIGTIAPGDCAVQYWHFTYPACENSETPPCTLDPVWGATNDPNDDLWLEFDIWGSANDGATPIIYADQTWRMTMRNEIRAMANKIEPHPDGLWFNTKTSTVLPGETITSNGVLYGLGNINKGFDNDGDYVPDYNAWLQPIGDPSYDPSCFRLIGTTGVLTVSRSGGNPDMYINFTDQLYFTDLPPDNTGVIGKVHYEFLALGGACSVGLSPYQEVASGFDNEKFNGDYGGASIPPVGSFEPEVTITKSSAPYSVSSGGGTFTYQIPFDNGGDSTAGLTLTSGGVNAPVVIGDTIPDGLEYVCGSATASLDYTPATAPGYEYIISTDSGATWVTGEPSGCPGTNPTSDSTTTSAIIIQWWLTDPLPSSANNGSGTAQFQAAVPGTYSGSNFIENCGEASLGDADFFAEACTTNMIEGTNSIGTYVWQDANADGSQDEGAAAGITAVQVSLYWDKNGDGALDSGDVLITTQDTSGVNDANYTFSNLPNGDYLVVVDDTDTDLPFGYGPTTSTTFAVTGLGTTVTSPYVDADFGFGPILAMTKALSSNNPAYEGENVTWTIDLVNTRPGDGTGQGSACTYTTYGNNYDASYTTTNGGNAEWIPYTNAFGPNEPDGAYSSSEFSNRNENIGITEFSIGGQAGSVSGVDVLVVFSVVNLGNFRPVPGESLDLSIIDTTTGTPIHSVSYLGATLNTWPSTFTLEEALPAGVVSGMTVADFNGSRYTISLIANGGGGNNTTYNAYLDLDAAGFRVTTDETCGGADDTITTLPLSDEYDSSLFSFVSASPAPDSATTGVGANYNPAGLLSWTNLGPLYAGQTQQVTVVLKALEPPDDGAPADGEPDPVTTINYASVTGATFANGNPVNDANDNASVTINPGGTIGDLIWNDMVGDGVYDADGADNIAGNADDEIGIPGVTVELQDGTCTPGSTCPTTVTDASGNYLFEGLQDSTTYVVVVDTTTLPNGGAGAANTHDRDTDNDSNSGNLTINSNDGSTANDDVLDADFGYTVPTLLEGSIWNDYNQSATSTADSGEEGLASVWVYVDDGSCTYVSPGGGTCQSAQTDANGDFTITGLTPAGGGTTYNVIVDTGTGDMSTGTWTQSYDTPNGPDGIPGTGDDTTNLDHTVEVTLYPGGLGNADYSYYETGSSTIGDTIFADWDGDATHDTTSEEGVSGVTVNLYEDSNGNGVIDAADDALIATTTTDAAGSYTFSNLPAGDYIVDVDENTLPSGYTQTYDPDNGGPGTACGTCDGQSSVTGVDGTSSYLTEDFGYQPVGYGSIGDFVWNDTDGDGVQDAGETGIASITVNLYEDGNGNGAYDPATDALIATTSTDASGNYIFNNLPAGDYLVDVDAADPQLPTDGNGDPYVVSSTYDHDNDTDTPQVTNDPMPVTLTAGQNYTDADFGFTTGGTIGDFIWSDNNGDGSQDPSEAGIASVAVELQDGTCTPSSTCPTATTNASGYYEFTGLPAGDYTVVVTAPAGHTPTGDPDSPTLPCSGGDCDNQAGVSLTAGQIDRSLDFGYQPPNAIGDTVWIDLNNNGTHDPDEPGIPGVTVELQDGACTPGSTCPTVETDSDGHYSFGNLSNGTYTVVVDTTDPDYTALGLTQNYDPDATLDSSTQVIVAGGVVTSVGGSCSAPCDMDADFGYNGINDVSGTVFYDPNDNATQDGGETIVYENVNIYLWNCGPDDTCGNADDISFGSTTTDANGDYSFNNLPDANYVVSVNPNAPTLTGLEATNTAAPTTYRIVDLDLAGVSGTAVSVPDQDFGFLSNMDLGDLPDTYGTSLYSNGARHIVPSSGAIYLGAAPPDTEADGQGGALADGDDGDGSDDDEGVTLDVATHWTPGASVNLNMDVGGGSGYLVGWFDWDGSGTFEADEMVEFGTLAAGSSIQSLTVPNDQGYVTGTDLSVRFRIFASDPGTPLPTGSATNGEVEDYIGEFGPTAITLKSFDASSDSMKIAWLALGAAVLLLAGWFTFRQVSRVQAARQKIKPVQSAREEKIR